MHNRLTNKFTAFHLRHLHWHGNKLHCHAIYTVQRTLATIENRARKWMQTMASSGYWHPDGPGQTGKTPCYSWATLDPSPAWWFVQYDIITHLLMKYTIELPKKKVSRFAAKQPAPGFFFRGYTNAYHRFIEGSKVTFTRHDLES
jgi:hypothetical protein